MCNMKPCSRRLLIHLVWLEPEWTGSNPNRWSLLWWFDPMCQWLTCYFYVVFLHVVLRICVYFSSSNDSSVHLPQNNKNTWIICHVHYKGPMALINFKTSLVIYFFSCALTLYSYHFVDLKNVYFCWNNVTPALVIITVLSSCSCINIRLIFVCNTL